MKEDKPCCAAEALRRIRQVDVGGIVVGLSMLDKVIADVEALEITSESGLTEELVKRTKIYNYIPKSAETIYGEALLKIYQKEVNNHGHN
ncbi:hypothetical protein E2N92_06855 [Methanofollis formosanus]|uniref:Uncharacterized protein n=1 Tax=Methanofollis formosanus TaxID=299308 RepID=A0A8G1EGQ4_9EURY|nr:hypothetical protein [Methanofollis formosanus]QYZ79172.1 hypothetical protein E2N92_06855 [Methanofollis formosanus]